MKIGVRSDCIAGSDLLEKMQIVKDLGYDFIELVLKPETIDNLNEQEIRSYIKLSSQTGLPFTTSSLGNFTQFAEMDAEKKKLMLEQIRKTIDLTATLGGDVILMACKESTPDIYSYVGIYKSELKEVADYALSKDVALALEPVGGYKTSVIGKLVREIGHPAIGMYYDMGNCRYGGEDPVDEARSLVDIIKAIHIKGTREASLDEMPLYAILKILGKGGFTGPGCIEIGSKDGTNAHLENAINVLRKVGY